MSGVKNPHKTDEFPEGPLGPLGLRLLLLGALRRWHAREGGAPTELSPARWLEVLGRLDLKEAVVVVLRVVCDWNLNRIADHLGIAGARARSCVHERLRSAGHKMTQLGLDEVFRRVCETHAEAYANNKQVGHRAKGRTGRTRRMM